MMFPGKSQNYRKHINFEHCDNYYTMVDGRWINLLISRTRRIKYKNI